VTQARPPRFVWLDNVRDRVRDRTLSSNASLVAHILGVHYVNGGKQAWPSQTELVASTGLGRRTVIRALNELEQTGFLDVDHKHRRGNVYELRLVPHRHQSRGPGTA
jgi:DNA-binding transcriptional regulator LsrR (DeoR family)